MKTYFNKAIKSLLFVDSLILIATAMLGPIYALFVEKIGGNLLDASLAFATFSITAGIITLISGNLSDKIKESELIIVFGYFITAIGFLLCLFIDSMIGLLATQVIIGIGEAIRCPAYDAIYSKHLDAGRGGKEWGAWESMYYFTSAIGAIIGGYLVVKFGFDIMFIFMAILSFSASLFIYLLPRKLL